MIIQHTANAFTILATRGSGKINLDLLGGRDPLRVRLGRLALGRGDRLTLPAKTFDATGHATVKVNGKPTRITPRKGSTVAKRIRAKATTRRISVTATRTRATGDAAYLNVTWQVTRGGRKIAKGRTSRPATSAGRLQVSTRLAKARKGDVVRVAVVVVSAAGEMTRRGMLVKVR